MYRILLVEDDPDIREVITDYFEAKEKDRFAVDCAKDGDAGLTLAYERSYDALLLDIMMPQTDGFEVCREVRRESDVPIIFITAMAAQEDMLKGYALGCDDYVVKPFPLPVLYEKVSALIKRSKGLVRSPVLTCGSLTLDPNSGRVTSGDAKIALTAKEFSILKILLENKNKVISRDRLFRSLWGYDSDIDERNIDAHIKNIRKSLGENARLIRTVRGRGYIMEDRDE